MEVSLPCPAPDLKSQSIALPNGCIVPNNIGLLSWSESVFSGSKGKTSAHWDEFAKLAHFDLSKSRQ